MNEELSKSRRRLVFLALLFIGPLALAWALYFAFDGWRPTGSTAHGELISPPLALAEVNTELLQGVAPDGLFRKTWTMGVVGGETCAERCAQTLVKIRQIRLTLGKDMDRVSRVLLVSRSGADLTAIGTEHPDLLVADSGDGDVGALLASFPGAEQAGNWVYLVDPLGNLMMRFGPDVDSHGIREDLKRLLRLSRIG